MFFQTDTGKEDQAVNIDSSVYLRIDPAEAARHLAETRGRDLLRDALAKSPPAQLAEAGRLARRVSELRGNAREAERQRRAADDALGCAMDTPGIDLDEIIRLRERSAAAKAIAQQRQGEFDAVAGEMTAEIAGWCTGRRGECLSDPAWAALVNEADARAQAARVKIDATLKALAGEFGTVATAQALRAQSSTHLAGFGVRTLHLALQDQAHALLAGEMQRVLGHQLYEELGAQAEQRGREQDAQRLAQGWRPPAGVA